MCARTAAAALRIPTTLYMPARSTAPSVPGGLSCLVAVPQNMPSSSSLLPPWPSLPLLAAAVAGQRAASLTAPSHPSISHASSVGCSLCLSCQLPHGFTPFFLLTERFAFVPHGNCRFRHRGLGVRQDGERPPAQSNFFPPPIPCWC